MAIEKTLLDKSANTLLEKAEECFDLAKAQQEAAEAQHHVAESQHAVAVKLDVSAGKLNNLGHALEADAVEILGESLVVPRGEDLMVAKILKAIR